MHYIRHYIIQSPAHDDIILKETLENIYKIKCIVLRDVFTNNIHSLVFDVPDNHIKINELNKLLPSKTPEEVLERHLHNIEEQIKQGQNIDVRMRSVDIHYYPVVSEEDLKNAKWLSVRSTVEKIVPINTSTLYRYDCPLHTDGDTILGQHEVQTEPVIINKSVKWGRNFFSSSLFGGYDIFCNNQAKSVLMKNNVTGIEYVPVLKKANMEPIDDIYQLNSTFTIPDKHILPISHSQPFVCRKCGMSMIHLEDARFRFAIDACCLDENIDFYKTPPIFSAQTPDCAVCAFEIFIISQRMYSVLHDFMLDTNLELIPINIIY